MKKFFLHFLIHYCHETFDFFLFQIKEYLNQLIQEYHVLKSFLLFLIHQYHIF